VVQTEGRERNLAMSDISSPPAASNSRSRSRANDDGPKRPPPAKLAIKVRVLGNDEAEARDLTFIGRDAWALKQLIAAGGRGCTPIDNAGPRWSHYIYKLRRGGLDVETVHEPHGGQFAGTHARYLLKSHVVVIELNDPTRRRQPGAVAA
jgi:hypothetical protein